ncbi:NUDIX hydrolase [Fibrobacter sp. UBA4297]|uniref:NUDIX hydrolase n=1 Tax=Fibrobacter sp. UBA4297 TaxID=1946536 RepID=UPI0025B99CA1|nr:NUDIX hydrolase [Fibrobacter sp. UBA4297]
MKPWKLLDSEFLVNAPWLKVAKETCELPNGKVIEDFYTLWQPDWVLILARTKEGKWVMTEQYRHGTGRIALEFPAGIIDKGETPEEAAVRELQEECGYVLDERRENAAMRLQTRDESVTLSEAPKMRSRTSLDSSTPLRSAQNDTANSVTYIGSFPVNPDRHRGKFHVVFIDGVERLGKTSFDDTEDIETFLYTDEEFQAKVADGTFNHPLQIAGYFKWKLSQSASRF